MCSSLLVGAMAFREAQGQDWPVEPGPAAPAQEQQAPAQEWLGWGRANDRGGGWGQQRHNGGGKGRQPARAYAPAHDPKSREMPWILQRIRATGDPTYSDVRRAAPHKTLGMEHAVKKRRKSQTFD